MRPIHTTLLLGVFALTGHAAPDIKKESIIPYPSNVQRHEGVCELKRGLTIFLPENGGEITSPIQAFAGYANKLGGVTYTIKKGRPKKTAADTIILKLTGELKNSEGYVLRTKANSVEIEAATSIGLYYGLQTFSQLTPLTMKEDKLQLPLLTITDIPRFKWRGIMLDCVRNFTTKENVKKIINNMAAYKFNVFHWHLVDDQAWRIEIKKYPQLTAKGAFYTQENVREIISYASARGITIVPEIEMPGHSRKALSVMKHLRCDPKAGQNVYCAGKDATFEFLNNVLTEVFELFPGEFVHIGGDEARKTYWQKCPDCKKRLKEENLNGFNELQSWFIRQVEPVFHKHNKRLIGWDEIIEGGLASSAAVMHWRDKKNKWEHVAKHVIEAADKGHHIVRSPQTFCYYDFPQDENRFNEPPGWNGFVTLRRTYEFDPVLKGLPKDKHKFVLGGQCNLWTERVRTIDHAEYMLFPRILGLSETLWSPLESRDYIGLTERILVHFKRLQKQGVNYRYPDGVEFTFKENTVTFFPELPTSKVRYTLDRSIPSESSKLYSGPLTVSTPQSSKLLL